MLFQSFSLHTFDPWLAAFQWRMSANRAEKPAKIPRGQLFRGLSACVSYTALNRAGGQGNLPPVEMGGATLCAPLGFLSACWPASHTQVWGKQGHHSFGSPSSQISNTQKRASDHFSPAGYALHQLSLKHLSSACLASPRSVMTHLYFNGGPRGLIHYLKRALRPSREECYRSARRLSLVTHTHMLCLCLCIFFSFYKTKICTSS